MYDKKANSANFLVKVAIFAKNKNELWPCCSNFLPKNTASTLC